MDEADEITDLLARAKAARAAGRLDELAMVLAEITQAHRKAADKLEIYASELAEKLRVLREQEAQAVAAESALARARLVGGEIIFALNGNVEPSDA